MPDILPIRLHRPAASCFLKAESWNLNHLLLISFRLARARRAPAPAKTPAFSA